MQPQSLAACFDWKLHQRRPTANERAREISSHHSLHHFSCMHFVNDTLFWRFFLMNYCAMCEPSKFNKQLCSVKLNSDPTTLKILTLEGSINLCLLFT